MSNLPNRGADPPTVQCHRGEDNAENRKTMEITPEQLTAILKGLNMVQVAATSRTRRGGNLKIA